MKTIYRNFEVMPLAGTKRDSDYALMIAISHEGLEEFKRLVARGMNTWDSASAELKELADLVIDGRIKQNYVAQAAQKEAIAHTLNSLN